MESKERAVGGYESMVSEVAELIAPFAREHGSGLHGVHMLGTSGTVTTIAGVHLDLKRYDRNRIDGCWMAADEIDCVLDRLVAMSYDANNKVSYFDVNTNVPVAATWTPFVTVVHRPNLQLVLDGWRGAGCGNVGRGLAAAQQACHSLVADGLLRRI